MPRSFLALSECDHCYQMKDLAGRHPMPEGRVHLVVFPKKDIRSIADVSVDDERYVLDCIGVIRALVTEGGLRNYRVVTNGPGFQGVTYLHFHLIARLNE